MRIEVKFIEEPDDTEDYANLRGKTLSITSADNIIISSEVDIKDDGVRRIAMASGSLYLRAHGQRPIWKDLQMIPRLVECDFFWGSHGCDTVGPHYTHICSCGAIYDPLKDGEPYGYDT